MDRPDEWYDTSHRDQMWAEGGSMAAPMYRVIAEQLRQQIEDREFEAGKQLPTEQELQERYGASRNTIRDAIKQLISLGLVETRPGQGTFVVPPIDPFVTTLTGDPTEGGGGGEGTSYASEVEKADRKPAVSKIKVEIQAASADVAAGLWIPVGTEVISRHRERYIDGKSWSLETSFYPGEFADRGAEKLRKAGDIDEGTVRYLQDTIGIRQVGYRDWISVRPPNAGERDFFSLPPDGRVAVVVNSRTAFDGNAQPMRLTVTVFRADRNEFIAEVGTVPPPKASTAHD
jgi:GntR family transcriptional regulator